MEHPAITGFVVMLFWGLVYGPLQWAIRKLFPRAGERLYRKRRISSLWRSRAASDAEQTAPARQQVPR